MQFAAVDWLGGLAAWTQGLPDRPVVPVVRSLISLALA